MTSITNLVPIRIDASSSDGAIRIIDTLLLDTKCLPISHAHPPHDGNPSGLTSLSGGRVHNVPNFFSITSLIDSNAAHLTESILADAEVYGSVKSSSKTFMGVRLELLNDTKLYQQIEKQIRTQLNIALSTDKKDLIADGRSFPHASSSAKVMNNESKIVPIKIRLRHDNIVVMDEFDYDINTSGLEGSEPLSIANSLVQDMRLPPELAPSIAASIVEQIFGVYVTQSLDGITTDAALQKNPTALVLDTARDGTSSDFAQYMLSI
jgi:hypothetical protein